MVLKPSSSATSGPAHKARADLHPARRVPTPRSRLASRLRQPNGIKGGRQTARRRGRRCLAKARFLGEEAAMATRSPRLRRVRGPNPWGSGGEVRYIGSTGDGWRDAYHYLLTMPLPAFFGVMAAGYIVVNAVFAALYVAVGGIQGLRPGD